MAQLWLETTVGGIAICVGTDFLNTQFIGGDKIEVKDKYPRFTCH